MILGIDASRANLVQKTGTEWYSFYLIQELKKIIPASIKVVLYSKEPLIGELAQLPNNWSNKILSWPPKFLWTQIRLSLEMLKIWSKPTILFIPAHTIPLIHPKKTILVAHDIGFEKLHKLYENKDLGYKNSFFRIFLKLLIKISTFNKYGISELDYHRWAMRFAIKHSFHIITVSNFSKMEIINTYHFPANKITVIHNGYSKNIFSPIEDAKKKSYLKIIKEMGIEIPYLLFIGRLELKKNIPKLIEAFAILKKKYKIPHKLILVGKPGFKYEEIEANIFQYKLNKDVIEMGYVSEKKINILMNLADLFIFPSLYEGFGIPLLEAMSANIPIACSKIGALEEVGGSAVNYFDPYDKQDMATIIFDSITDYARRDKMIAAGKIRCNLFSYKKCAQSVWQVLSQYI